MPPCVSAENKVGMTAYLATTLAAGIAPDDGSLQHRRIHCTMEEIYHSVWVGGESA